MSEGKLLTEGQLLEAFNIQADRTAVWRWRKKGMPHVKVGRAIRYDLAEVRAWLATHGENTVQSPAWEWSVWSWVPAEEQSDGRLQPGFWYQECLCRNQVDAENIMELFRRSPGTIHYRASQAKPRDTPTHQEEVQQP